MPTHTHTGGRGGGGGGVYLPPLSQRACGILERERASKGGYSLRASGVDTRRYSTYIHTYVCRAGLISDNTITVSPKQQMKGLFFRFFCFLFFVFSFLFLRVSWSCLETNKSQPCCCCCCPTSPLLSSPLLPHKIIYHTSLERLTALHTYMRTYIHTYIHDTHTVPIPVEYIVFSTFSGGFFYNNKNNIYFFFFFFCFLFFFFFFITHHTCFCCCESLCTNCKGHLEAKMMEGGLSTSMGTGTGGGKGVRERHGQLTLRIVQLQWSESPHTYPMRGEKEDI